MNEPTYLYSYGTRRHIADPDVLPSRTGARAPLCEPLVRYDTDVLMAAELRRWTTPENAEKRAARKRAFPVCKRCEKKAADHG